MVTRQGRGRRDTPRVGEVWVDRIRGVVYLVLDSSSTREVRVLILTEGYGLPGYSQGSICTWDDVAVLWDQRVV